MTLDDIRRLNIREAGSWPLLPKVVVLTLILVAVGSGAAARHKWLPPEGSELALRPVCFS